MKKSIILMLAASTLLFASCASSRFYSEKASAIQPIAFVQPYSYITDAIDDWATEYLDEVSQVNQELLSKAVNSVGLPIQKSVAMAYNKEERSALNDWMHRFGNMNATAARDLVIPGELRDAVGKSGCRYGLVVADFGYLKNAKELALEKGIDTATKVLDAVLNKSIDLSDNAESCLNSVYALIFDNQTGNVVWFGSQPRRYKKNPVDPRIINDQVNALFKDFR